MSEAPAEGVTPPFDALAACEAQITDRERKLAARKGKHEYRENVPALEAELERLRGVRDMIRDGRLASQDRETER